MSRTPSRSRSTRPSLSSPAQVSPSAQRTPTRDNNQASSTSTSPQAGQVNLPQWADLTWVPPPPPRSSFRAQLKYKADMAVLLAMDKSISINFARQIVQHVIDTIVDTIIDEPNIRNSATAQDEFQWRLLIAQGKKSLRGRMYHYIMQIVEEQGGSFYASLVRQRDDFVEVSIQLAEEINASNSQAEFQSGAAFGNLVIGYPPPSVIATSRINENSDMTTNDQLAARFEEWETMAQQGQAQSPD